MADISPVRDPNFENWNYARQLDQAVSPIVQQGQNRLALSQQQGSRMFELAAQQKQAELQQRNRIAEMSAEEANREKFAASETARQKQEVLKSSVAEAKTINPDFSPDPNKSDDENIAAAKNIGYQKTAEAAKKLIDAQNVAKGQAMGLIDEYGKPVNIDDKQLGTLVANDPQFVNRLSPTQKQLLASGKVTPNGLINSLQSGRVVAGFESFFTGVDPRSLASDIANSAQTARQTLISKQQQIIGAKLGLSQQELQSRANTYNELFPKVVAGLPPHMIADVMDYASKTSAPLGVTSPAAAPPSGVNQDVLDKLGGGGAPPPPAPQPAPAIPDAIPPTPGVPANFDPSTFQDAIRRNSAAVVASGSKKDVSDAQDRIKFLENILSGGKIDAPQTPAYAQWAAALAPQQQGNWNPTPEQGLMYSKEHLDLLKKLPKLQQKAIDDERFHQSLIQQPPAPPQPPPGQRWNVPQNVIQPPPQVQQPGQPQANNVDPMQIRAAQNHVAQTFGTSDPGVLNAAKNVALQSGMSPDAIQQTVNAAVRGDPQAIQTVKSFISRAQGQNNGQIAAMPQIQPQTSFAS